MHLPPSFFYGAKEEILPHGSAFARTDRLEIYMDYVTISAMQSVLSKKVGNCCIFRNEKIVLQ